jgi:hypothetical protein
MEPKNVEGAGLLFESRDAGWLLFAAIGDSKTGCQTMMFNAFIQQETVILQKSTRVVA